MPNQQDAQLYSQRRYSAYIRRTFNSTPSHLDFAHSIIGRVFWFQWLMWLSEAHADISVHLMGLNPGPGHGGMSCTSPSKSTFSIAWHHNRNAKNAQSQAEVGCTTEAGGAAAIGCRMTEWPAAASSTICMASTSTSSAR